MRWFLTNNRSFYSENGGVQIAQAHLRATSYIAMRWFSTNNYSFLAENEGGQKDHFKQVGCHPMTAVTNRNVACVRVRAYIYPRVLLPYYSGIVGNSNVLSYAHVRTCASVCAYAGRRTRESQRFLPDRCPPSEKLSFFGTDNFQVFSSAFRAVLSGTSCRSGLPRHFTFSK